MLRAMVGIGIMCALLIVLTYEGTFDRIERNKAEALERAIFKVLPGIESKQAFYLTENDAFIKGESDDSPVVYAGYTSDGELAGIAVEASGMGFADVLRILYGYDPKTETIVGFYVLESKETPGLGDKIEKDDDFLANFKELDVSLDANKENINNKVVPVKHGEKTNAWEVDGITGATISSRAIGDIIGTSSEILIPVIYKNLEVFENTSNERQE